MLRFGSLILSLVISLAAFAVEQPAAPTAQDPYEQAREGIVKFGLVYRELLTGYVDQVNHNDILKAGIDGMLSKLDPYTEYMDASGAQELEIMQTGKYGGIGVELGVRGTSRDLTVMSLFDGYPAARAGIRPGDIITQVDTMNASGWTTAKASSHLRGTPGTSITLTIRRGTNSLQNFTLTRAAIEVKEVGLSTTLDNNIGYIKLVRFGRYAARDIDRALDSLMKQPLSGVILDLRQNPGGLLGSAIEVSQLFLPKGATIVTTRSRDTTESQIYRSMREPKYTGPLAVLVDEGSASASEIVAGALQDNDRAVIIGKPSFGKGLVQTIRKLPGEATLKMTTSKYFTPSGRLIQKVDYFHGGDSVSIAGRKFTSKNGRPLSALGGITPDIDTASSNTGALANELLRQGMLFSFVNDFLTDSILRDHRAQADDVLLTKLRAYLTEKKFNIPLPVDAEWKTVREWIDKQPDAQSSEDIQNALNQWMELRRNAVWNDNRNTIKRMLAIELGGYYEGSTGRYRASAHDEVVVQKAIVTLANPAIWQAAMSNKEASVAR